MSSYFEGRGSFRRTQVAEEVDPMASLANIGDIMLVFACGLMTALVIAWNVDLGQFSQVEIGEAEAIPEPMENNQVVEGGGSTYVERGVVYQDAATGKYYLIEPDSTSAAAGTARP